LFTRCTKKESPEVESIEQNDPIQFKNVLILGNSMTKHSPAPVVGWYGNWGMAASAESKDFSHLIGAALKAKITPVNLGEFELNHTIFDLKTLKEYFISKPDLVIVRFGENVLQPKDFDKSFVKFLNYIQDEVPDAKIVIAGTFWQNNSLNKVFSDEAQARNIPYVRLQDLDTPKNKTSIGSYMFSVEGSRYKVTHQGVADHPGDLGMKNIADLILAKVNSIPKTK
jgi:hypothetical protein